MCTSVAACFRHFQFVVSFDGRFGFVLAFSFSPATTNKRRFVPTTCYKCTSGAVRERLTISHCYNYFATILGSSSIDANRHSWTSHHSSLVSLLHFCFVTHWNISPPDRRLASVSFFSRFHTLLLHHWLPSCELVIVIVVFFFNRKSHL